MWGLTMLILAGCDNTGGRQTGLLIEPSMSVDGSAECLLVTDDATTHEDGSLNQFLETPGKTVIVDFWATWCPPCKMLSPELMRVAMRRREDVIVVKINIDHEPELAQHFQVGAIPDIRVFRDGKAVDSFPGFHTADEILARLDSLKADH